MTLIYKQVLLNVDRWGRIFPSKNGSGYFTYPSPIVGAFKYFLAKTSTKRGILGTYAFRVPDDNGAGGVWVGYEDPDTAGSKAAYAKALGLGGVGIIDITLDDFRGLCTTEKYPILRGAKFRL